MTELRDQLQGTLGAAYALERELGGGGMSRVFVATETALGRPVVVKVLLPELAGTVNIERFRREVRLAATLQHPHIVPLLAAGETGGVPYYTMPFVEGESLRDRLRSTGALPLTEAVAILRDVARALAFAHARGIVHRDIKPDNVLLCGGSAMVTDFGIAKAIASASGPRDRVSFTMSGTTVGTPAYMAPEQAAADPLIDHRADLYAFGCMAYELLTGEPPAAAGTGSTPVPIERFRPDVPRQLESLVMRCLEADPARRPQDAEAIIEALETHSQRHTAQLAIPTALLVPVVLGRALMLYVAGTIAVLLLLRTLTPALDLPGWTLPAVMIALAVALPMVLRVTWRHYHERRAASEAPMTPAAPHDDAHRF